MIIQVKRDSVPVIVGINHIRLIEPVNFGEQARIIFAGDTAYALLTDESYETVVAKIKEAV